MSAPKNPLTGNAIFPLKTLFVEITIGATGAVTSYGGYGVNAVTRTSTGLYNIVLDGDYVKFVGATVTPVASVLDGLAFSIKAEDVDDSSDPEVDLFVFDPAAGTVVDPNSGTVLKVEIRVQDTLV
jgi:hypothetical protein